MEKLLYRIENVLTHLSVVSIFIMVFMTTFDTIGRYIFSMPIPGGNEITAKYLMVIAVFFGLSYGYHRGSNIRVTFLVRFFPRRIKLFLDHFIQIVSALLGILLVIGSFRVAFRNFHIGLMDIPSIPVGPAYLVVSIGLILFSLWLLYDINQVRKGKSGLFVEEDEANSIT